MANWANELLSASNWSTDYEGTVKGIASKMSAIAVGAQKAVKQVGSSLTGGLNPSKLSDYATKPEVQRDVLMNAAFRVPGVAQVLQVPASVGIGYQTGQELGKLWEGRSIFGNAEWEAIKEKYGKPELYAKAIQDNPISAITSIIPEKAVMGMLPGFKPSTYFAKKGIKPIEINTTSPLTDLIVKDIQNDTHQLLKGSPYEISPLTNNQFLIKSGDNEFIASKNVADNLMRNSIATKVEAPFTKGFEGLEESIKANRDYAEIQRTKQGIKSGEEINIGLPKYESENLNLPGGKNYREILIKAPLTKEQNDVVKLFNERNIPLDQMKGGPSIFKHSHFPDDANVVTILRMDERNTINGEKATNISELQSDWNREYKEYGKLDDMKTVEGIAGGRVPATVDESKRVPYHPALEQWEELGLKRALKEAVDNGSEYLTWSSGKTIKDRYSLSKQVEEISWEPYAQGKVVTIIPKSADRNLKVILDSKGIVMGGEGGIDSKWIHKPIDDIVGKDIARKILTSNKEYDKLTGEGLDIGGKWTENLYDNQYPNILKDMTKKFGGEIKEIELGKKQPYSIKENLDGDFDVIDNNRNRRIGVFSTEKEALNYIGSENDVLITQKALKITPQIKAWVKGELK